MSLARYTATRVLTALVALSLTPALVHGGPLDACARLYGDAVHPDGSVDYARVAAHADRAACTRALAEAPAPPADAPRAQALAFWADAYNLLTMLAIADEPQRWGAQQDGKSLFRDRRFTVAGQHLTLDQLERDRLAGRAADPRVEFLLSCGSRSCALLPRRLLSASAGAPTGLTGAPGPTEIDQAMREGMRRWFARSDNLRVRRDLGVVELGQLLQRDWHGQDFERAGTSLVELVARALEDRAGPGDVEAARALRAGGLRLKIRPYDWRVNRARRAYLLP
jgi:hypothetical protein